MHVMIVYRFSDEREALAIANSTRYGLASYVYSNDLGELLRVVEGLEFGMVGVNEPIISTEGATFGGHKESGLGNEGAKFGMLEYLSIKYICIGVKTIPICCHWCLGALWCSGAYSRNQRVGGSTPPGA